MNPVLLTISLYLLVDTVYDAWTRAHHCPAAPARTFSTECKLH